MELRIIFEAAAGLRTALGRTWTGLRKARGLPTKNDMIFLHGPMVNPAAGGTRFKGLLSGKKYPPYSKETYDLFAYLTERNAELPEHRDEEPSGKISKIYTYVL